MTSTQAEIHPKTVRAVTRVVAAAKAVAPVLAGTSAKVRDAALEAIAVNLEEHTEDLLAANAEDLVMARGKEIPQSSLDRLALDEQRIANIVDSVRTVAALPDPVGELVEGRTLTSGIQLYQERVPLGLVAAIYEARPNVTVDIAALALKSGNTAVLRGGNLAKSSNSLLLELMRQAIVAVGLPKEALSSVDEWGRDGARVLMTARDYVDLLIPRGGAELISTVVRESIVPVIETGVGNVHIFVDQSAPVRMATNIVVNSKTKRRGVFNSVETLLVQEKAAKRVLPKLLGALSERGVVVHAGPDVAELAPDGVAIRRVARRDWAKEYLGLEIAVKIVAGLDEAIEHIRSYSSGHTEVIVTNDMANADAFVSAVDAAAVGVNVSTRFTDGEEFGLGAELGISTQKLHARGPMGLRALTTVKWVMRGSGQVRE